VGHCMSAWLHLHFHVSCDQQFSICLCAVCGCVQKEAKSPKAWAQPECSSARNILAAMQGLQGHAVTPSPRSNSTKSVGTEDSLPPSAEVATATRGATGVSLGVGPGGDSGWSRGRRGCCCHWQRCWCWCSCRCWGCGWGSGRVRGRGRPGRTWGSAAPAESQVHQSPVQASLPAGYCTARASSRGWCGRRSWGRGRGRGRGRGDGPAVGCSDVGQCVAACGWGPRGGLSGGSQAAQGGAGAGEGRASRYQV